MMKMVDMLKKVSDTLNEYRMLNDGERVMVGLSGGADSVSLALCLKELGYDVCCVHVNHCLRGEESDRDERFCREFCQRMGMELSVHRLDVGKYCADNKLSTELGARKLRYEAFEKAANDMSASKIATAHTLSDCLETTLLNLVRGGGVKGLSGIPPVREQYIRPLINCTREEIESFLEERNESYVTDSTNLVDDCSRNIIRLKVIPQLERVNAGVFKSYLSTVKVLRDTDEYLEKKCQEAIIRSRISNNSFDVQKLTDCDELITRTAISRIMKDFCGESSYERVTDVVRICSDEGKITLKGGIYAENKRGKLTFYCDSEPVGDYEQKLSLGETLCVFGKSITVRTRKADDKCDNVHKKFTNKEIDYDKIVGSIFVRNRRNGDRVKLSGRGVTSSVKTLFNASVPQENRQKMLFVCDDEGIIFAEDFGCAERVKCTDSTENVLEISVDTVTEPSQ